MITVDLFSALLKGFTLNLMMTFSAMGIGYPVGVLLAQGLGSRFVVVRGVIQIIKSLFGNVPSFVMLFYLTTLLPSTWHLMGITFHLSAMAKAIIALMIPVIGYTSDAVYQKKQRAQPITANVVKQYFLVLLMASTTASAIDVKEILATANQYIAASGETTFMLPLYLIVGGVFITFGLITQIMFWTFQWFSAQGWGRHRTQALHLADAIVNETPTRSSDSFHKEP